MYYFGEMPRRCIAVYETFINLMNDNIRDRATVENRSPFKFDYVRHVRSTMEEDFSGREACVAIASPGMLQSGNSLELFERWCNDENNAVVLAGYACNGTLAKQLITGQKNMTSPSGKLVRCQRYQVSFSAHADCKQTTDFIRRMKPGIRLPSRLLVDVPRARRARPR